MWYIVLAVFFSSCIIISFRLFSIFKIHNLQAITINYVVASVLSYLTFGENVGLVEIVQKPWFFWSVLNGILFILVFFVFARSAQKAGVAITAVASKMSVIIPVAIGVLIYKDELNGFKMAGILSAFPAFYLIFAGRQSHEPNLKYIFLPVLLFLGTGSNDSIMKHAQKFYIGDEYLLFLASVFFVALLIGLSFSARQTIKRKESVKWRSIGAGILLGFFNFSSTYFFLRSLAIFESSVFFPVFNVSIVSMGALIGYLVFKEKLQRKNWLGIGMAVATILFIAMS